jgi:hypothetical protein
VIARVLRATTRSEQAALTMAVLWGQRVCSIERTAPGFQGGVLLREGTDLLAVSCWDELPACEAALEPVLDQVASSTLTELLAKPLSYRFRVL